MSEPAGTPGGTANFDHPGGQPVGIGVTCTHDKGRGEYVLNGRKKWPCNSGGWDLQGADANIVIVRTGADDSEGQAIGAMSKVFCGETLFNSIFQCMQVMGVNSLDRSHPVERYLREALVFPLYDAGNIGMQMRKIWGVMADKDFDPRAFMDSSAIEYKKSMEGWTAVANG